MASMPAMPFKSEPVACAHCGGDAVKRTLGSIVGVNCDRCDEKRATTETVDDIAQMQVAARLAALERAIPTRYETASFDTLDASTRGALHGWDDRTGSGLFLTGQVGTGKTWAAAAVVREAAPRFDSIAWVCAPEWLESVRRSFNDPSQKPVDIVNVSLLVIDDLGAEKPSEWVRERLYTALNARYSNMRSTIVTSNLDLDQIARSVGQRVASRLAEDCRQITFGGNDRRIG